MSKDTLGIALIGAGWMGQIHAREWTARKDARIVSVFDPLPDAKERIVREYGAASCDSYQQAIEYEGVRAVSVCTPTCFHSEIACHAAQRGRHVLTEKPLALTLEQGQAMISAARKNGVHLSVGFQYREGWPSKARQLFGEGLFGGPIICRVDLVAEVRPKLAMHRRSFNGGPVIDVGCHYVDILRFITGSEPRRVFARGHVFGRGKPRLGGIDDLAIDAAIIVVEMTDGHLLEMNFNWGMPEGFPPSSDICLAGPALLLRPSAVLPGLSSNPAGQMLAIQAGCQTLWEVPVITTASRINELANAIRGEAPLTVTGQDGLVALQTTLAAIQSIETGYVVDLTHVTAAG